MSQSLRVEGIKVFSLVRMHFARSPQADMLRGLAVREAQVRLNQEKIKKFALDNVKLNGKAEQAL
jgi:hypothetical protein